MKHSKEPWRSIVTTTGIRHIMSKHDQVIADVNSLEDGIDNAARNKEANDNAKLIAAAPELLAACEAIKVDVGMILANHKVPRKHRHGSTTRTCESIMRSFDAAIAKATE